MRGLRKDGGNVAIIFATVLTVLTGLVALVVDVGALMIERQQLQTGADAAALSIARKCAEFATDASVPFACDDSMAADEVDRYVTDNAAGFTASLTTPLPDLQSALDNRAGAVTVVAESTTAPLFAGVLGVTEQTVGSTATARWGPLIEGDSVFPLTVCRGALPPPDSEVLVVSDTRDDAGPPDICDGAPAVLPLGWLAPDDLTACTAEVRTVPPNTLSVASSDDSPTASGCTQALTDLGGAVASGAPPDERTRLLAIHDADAGIGGSHPAFSLVGFEFTGVRLGTIDARIPGSDEWTEPCDDVSDPDDEVQCIRGTVRQWLPPDDGVLAAIDDLTLPGVDDTTVLDVRLVE